MRNKKDKTMVSILDQDDKSVPLKGKERRELQYLVLQRVCQALTDAEIPFEEVWCAKIENSDAHISLIVNCIEYTREIKRK